MGIDAVGLVTFKKENRSDEINAEISKCFRDDECFKLNSDGTINFDLQRYYGPYYERGNAMKIITTLEFLRRHESIECVFYNGDSIEDFVLWTEERCKEYLDLWFKSGHKGYWK